MQNDIIMHRFVMIYDLSTEYIEQFVPHVMALIIIFFSIAC